MPASLWSDPITIVVDLLAAYVRLQHHQDEGNIQPTLPSGSLLQQLIEETERAMEELED